MGDKSPKVCAVGFEPTPPKRTGLEPVALDHSAMHTSRWLPPRIELGSKGSKPFVMTTTLWKQYSWWEPNPRPPAHKTSALTTELHEHITWRLKNIN